MTPKEKEQSVKRILDQAQIDALVEIGRDRASAVAYCNAAINSGLGALENHYSGNERMADLAVLSVLTIWLDTVKKKAERREASNAV